MILSSSLFTTAILSIELRIMLRRRRKGEVVQSSKQVSTKQLNKMSLAERQISIEMDAEGRTRRFSMMVRFPSSFMTLRIFFLKRATGGETAQYRDGRGRENKTHVRISSL